MIVEASATGAAAGATGAVVPTVVTPAGAAAGEEFKAMTPAQFAERLAAERAHGAKGVLKDLGVDKVEDAKARLEADKKRSDAELTESQRQAALVASLTPKAASAERYENAVKAQLEAWEQAVPADKKVLLELAPVATDLAGRFEWFTKAHKAKLFETATAQQPLANSRAGGAAPPGKTGGTLAKRPEQMTKEERVQAKAEAEAKVRAGQT